MRTRTNHVSLAATVLSAGFCASCASCVTGADAPTESGESSSATINDAMGTKIGTITFKQVANGTRAEVSAQVPGFTGIHGFHVHANDNPANGDGCIADPAQPPAMHFLSADGHFNPGGGVHGGHAGDMPALFFAQDGTASINFVFDHFTPSQVVGRVVLIHQGPDNYGNLPLGAAANQYTANSQDAVTLTQGTGNAGVRVGCGLIQ